MATIKSYSDLQQSKKLAEILPFESADMYWQSNLNSSDRQYLLDMGEEEYFDIEMNFEHCSIGDYDIPAWSLAALLEQLPYEVVDDDGNSVYLQINKEDDVYQLVYTDPYENFKSIETDIETDRYEHFVDACVEMIEKLHELNLLRL